MGIGPPGNMALQVSSPRTGARNIFFSYKIENKRGIPVIEI